MLWFDLSVVASYLRYLESFLSVYPCVAACCRSIR